MSKECERYAVDLSAYFDDELEPVEAAGVKAHVASCAHCQAQLDKMRDLRLALNRTNGPALPQNRLLQDLMRTLRQPEKAQPCGGGANVTRGR